MAQIIMPNRRPKDDPLDTIIKGLSIASQVYGIKTNMAQLDDFEKKNKLADEDRARAESERKRLEAGQYNKNERIELSKHYDISDKPSEGAIQISSTEAPNTPLYLSVRGQKQSPLIKTIEGMKGGVAGTIVKDYASGGKELDFIPKAKQPGSGSGKGKLTVIETVNEHGDPIQKVVELKAGEVFEKPAGVSKIVGANRIPGYQPTAKDAEEAKVIRTARDNIADGVRQLDKIYRESGTELVGANADALKRIVTGIQLNMKELERLGAITGPDLQLMEGLVPDPSSFEENVKGLAGIDRYQSGRNTFMNMVESRLENSLKARGFQRTDKPLNAYTAEQPEDEISDDDIRQELNKRLMMNAQGK